MMGGVYLMANLNDVTSKSAIELVDDYLAKLNRFIYMKIFCLSISFCFLYSLISVEFSSYELFKNLLTAE